MCYAQSPPKKQKIDLPKIFDSAQYVYVEAYNGDAFDPDVYPRDRQAIYDVEKGLRDWGRYSLLATSREQAELVFVVRKGATAKVTVPVVVGGGSRPQPGSPSQRSPFPSSTPDPGDNSHGVGVGTEVGPPDDMLSVYMVSSSGSRTGPIWMRSLKHGLDGPNVPLFKQIKEEIQKAYPR